MWFEQPPDDRIIAWREWRNGLENLSVEQALEEVASTWARVPTVLHYLAPDQINEWPNPWQLITDNIYCDLAICLGMYYTLALIEQPKIQDLQLKIYQGPEGWINLSSIDQGKYVLNYNHGTVVNMSCVEKDNAKLIFSYLEIDLCNKFN
jgi:hypothetical protein